MLNTDVSSLKQKKTGFILKPVYFLIQFLIYEISLLLGLTIASFEDTTTYPITTSSFIPSLFGYYLIFLLPIHGVNGILTIPGEKKCGLSKNIRITIFLVNLLISMYVIYLMLGTVAHSAGYGGTYYGVFDKSSLFFSESSNNQSPVKDYLI